MTTDLPRYAVGIDVETTSLDPAAGDIIDVAAIRYDLTTGQEVDRFEQLCQPHGTISSEIESLTGITTAMVEGKPFFSEVVERLRECIGTDQLFAHNASFDLAWLAQHGLTLTNPMWDTFPLSAIAWPESSSYNLGMLAKDLGLVATAEHRAAADVEVSWLVLQKIREELMVAADVKGVVDKLLAAASLSHYAPLFSVEKGNAIASQVDHVPLPRPAKPLGEVGTRGIEGVSAKASNPSNLPLSGEGEQALTIKDCLGKGGLLEQRLPGFTYREAQLKMAQAVTAAIATGKPALLEAGTGTGKTYGYLVPGILALTKHRPLIVSTHTRHLQDQLVTMDLPRLLTAMGRTHRVALLKGRRNYLCDRRLATLVERLSHPAGKAPAASAAESFFAIKLLLWAAGEGSGDLERLNVSHQDQRLLRFVHADALSCRLECGTSASCPYQRARAAAARADIIVVNHALLMQGGLGDEELLQGAVVIIDEGHHLASAARQAGQLDLSSARVGEMVAPWRQATAAADTQKARHVAAECQALLDEYAAWVKSAGEFVRRHAARDRLLLTPGVRRSAGWGRLLAQGRAWQSRLSFVGGLVKTLAPALPARSWRLLEEALAGSDRYNREFDGFIAGNDQRIQWIELQVSAGKPDEQRVVLYDMPLDVSPQIKAVAATSQTVILTSATLSIAGDFAYVQRQLGLPDWREATLPAPFNYREHMLIYLVDDSPLPASPAYDDYLARNIAEISLLLGGRTLGLFTSLRSVSTTYYMLIKKLNEANIKLFAQGITGGRSAMLARFRTLDESVLLGTASFWEGVDIVGESLSCVVIPKLPFAPPDDPILTARSLAAGTSMFRDESVPQMILKIRQGIGRLIRSTSDRGVVVIFDSRLHRSDYGEAVIKSLPPGQVHIGSHRDLIPTIRRWFGEKTIGRWNQSASVTR